MKPRNPTKPQAAPSDGAPSAKEILFSKILGIRERMFGAELPPVSYAELRPRP